MAYTGIAEEYSYSFREAAQGAVTLNDLHNNVIKKLEVERNWGCLEGDEGFKLENNEYVYFKLYTSYGSLPGIRYESVIFHWNAKRTYCQVFICPVYEPREPDGYYYFEGRGISWRMSDGCIYCVVRDTYADSYDIHDHDHYSTETGYVYDPAKKELKYYIP